MNSQELFNKVSMHLLTQLEKSWGELPDGTMGCMYGHSGGKQCAIGPLLRNPTNWETHGILDISRSEYIDPPDDTVPDSLIRSLQFVHDDKEVDDWRKGLQEVATEFSLTMIPYTLEEVFRISAKHLLKQGVKSITVSGVCKYRGPNGLMCAAGPFVKDDCPEGEKFSVMQPFWIEGITVDVVPLINSLQILHDWTDPCNWKQALTELYMKAFKGKEIPEYLR